MTTDDDLYRLAAEVRIPLGQIHFRDELPEKGARWLGIINLSKTTDPINPDGSRGSHWVAYFTDRKKAKKTKANKNGNLAYYFDSFGRKPPAEIERFLRKKADTILYWDSVVQLDTSERCGQLCIEWLTRMITKTHAAMDMRAPS